MLPYPLSADELVADVLQDLDTVTEAVRTRFGGLADVTRTNEVYRGVLAPALRAGREAGRKATGSLRGRWFGRHFTGWMAPGGGLKALRALAAHEARHLAQARRVLDDPRFPH